MAKSHMGAAKGLADCLTARHASTGFRCSMWLAVQQGQTMRLFQLKICIDLSSQQDGLQHLASLLRARRGQAL